MVLFRLVCILFSAHRPFRETFFTSFDENPSKINPNDAKTSFRTDSDDVSDCNEINRIESH